MAKAPFTLGQIGQIGHIGLAVRDPRESAKWYIANLGMKMQFEFDGGIAIGSDGITLVLHKGRPSPKTIGHVSFHLPDAKTLKKALAFLKKHDIDVEDPGDEIGPEAGFAKHRHLVTRPRRLSYRTLRARRCEGVLGQDLRPIRFCRARSGRRTSCETQ